MRVCVHDRIFVEHLPVGLIPRKRLIVRYLRLNLRLNFAQVFGQFAFWKLIPFAVVVCKARLSFILWYDVILEPLRAHLSTLNRIARAPMRHLPVCSWCSGRCLVVSLKLLPVTYSLSGTLGWLLLVFVKIVDLPWDRYSIHFLFLVLAGEARHLSVRTGAARLRWAKLHGHGTRHLVSHLVSPPLWAALDLLSRPVSGMLFVLLLLSRLPVSSPPNPDPIFLLSLYHASRLLHFIPKLEAAPIIHIATAVIAVQFLLSGRASVRHWLIRVTIDFASDRRRIAHCSVGVRL